MQELTLFDMPASDLPGAPKVVELTGATYRQLNYWVTRGFVRPVNDVSGSGYRQHFGPEDVELVRVMVLLVNHFGIVATDAARTARELIASGLVHRGPLVLVLTGKVEL